MKNTMTYDVGNTGPVLCGTGCHSVTPVCNYVQIEFVTKLFLN